MEQVSKKTNKVKGQKQQEEQTNNTSDQITCDVGRPSQTAQPLDTYCRGLVVPTTAAPKAPRKRHLVATEHGETDAHPTTSVRLINVPQHVNGVGHRATIGTRLTCGAGSERPAAQASGR